MLSCSGTSSDQIDEIGRLITLIKINQMNLPSFLVNQHAALYRFNEPTYARQQSLTVNVLIEVLPLMDSFS